MKLFQLRVKGDFHSPSAFDGLLVLAWMIVETSVVFAIGCEFELVA